MSFKSLLQSGITALFGGSVEPQSDLPDVNNTLKGADIQTVIETMKKIKDMTQSFMQVQAACLQLRTHINSDLPELDTLDETIHISTEASIDTLLENCGMIQKWDGVKINDAIAKKVNATVFLPIAISTMRNYSDTLVKCAAHLEVLNALNKIAPVENGEKISAQLKAALMRRAS